MIGSSAATNEELFLLERLARQVIGTPHVDHQLEPFDGLSAAEHELGIAEIEDCDALIVLGAEPEEHAPVLTLRLYKAEHKKGARVTRLRSDVAAADAVAAVSGASRIGLIADETNRAHAADLAAALRAVGTVRRLTITRGMNGRGAKDLGLLPNVGPGYASLTEPGMNGRKILEGLAAGSMRGLLMLGPNPALEAAGRAARARGAQGGVRGGVRHPSGGGVPLRDGAVPWTRDLREGRQRHQRRGARAADPRRAAARERDARWRRAC